MLSADDLNDDPLKWRKKSIFTNSVIHTSEGRVKINSKADKMLVVLFVSVYGRCV